MKVLILSSMKRCSQCYPWKRRKKAIAEYFRVLKPNGLLLTHDVMLVGNDHQTILENMRKAINVTVTPLTKDGWKGIFKKVVLEMLILSLVR